MRRGISVLLVALVGLVGAAAEEQPDAGPATVFVSDAGLTQTSPRDYWVYSGERCIATGKAGKPLSVPAGEHEVRVGFPSGYVAHAVELKGGERTVVPTGLFTFRQVTPAGMRSTVPQELYQGDTYLATGYQGTTVRLLPGKYTVLYQPMESEKPSVCFSPWFVVGPFGPQKYQEALAAVQPVEQETTRDFRRTYPAKPKPLAWRRVDGVPGIELMGVVTRPGAAYAASYLQSEVERPAQIILNRSGAVKVWLNGELLHTDEDKDALSPGGRLAFLRRLRKGYNELLVKTARVSYNWQLGAVACYPQVYEVTVAADGKGPAQ